MPDSKGFLKECLVRLGTGIKGLFLRADAGFYSSNFLKCLERRRVWYAVAAKLYPAIPAQLAGVGCRDIGSGVEVGEFQYQGSGWKKGAPGVVPELSLEAGIPGG